MKKLIFVLCVLKRIHVDTQRTHENETTPKTEPQKCVLISEAYTRPISASQYNSRFDKRPLNRFGIHKRELNVTIYLYN